MDAIEAFANEVGIHRPFPIADQDEKGALQIKVFEMYDDKTTCDSIFFIEKYSELVTEFKTNCLVRIEWQDVEDTKGKPYFLFF